MTIEQKSTIEQALAPLRLQIDELDSQLLVWLEKRVALIRQVGEVKNAYGVPPLSKAREEAILLRVKEEATSRGIPESLVEDIWRSIFSAAYILEEKHNE